MDEDKPAASSEPTEASAPAAAVPTIDPNSPLKIDQVIKGLDVPETDINATLEMEKDPNAVNVSDQDKSDKSLFFLGSLIMLVIIISAAGFYFYLTRSKSSGDKDLRVIQEVSTEENSDVEFVRSSWNLEVQNGSGVAGLAKKAANQLQDLGYTILSTGNADKNNYKGVQIFVSLGLQGQSKALVEDITKNYREATLAGELKDSTASARIIVGKE